jgi:hypothetical protein
MYYYYLGGEEEISEMLKDEKWPWRATVGYLVVAVLTVAIRLYQYRNFWKALGLPTDSILFSRRAAKVMDDPNAPRGRVIPVQPPPAANGV